MTLVALTAVGASVVLAFFVGVNVAVGGSDVKVFAVWVARVILPTVVVTSPLRVSGVVIDVGSFPFTPTNTRM